jgi:tetratricopeptide (TPR) repeat protein
MKLVLKAPVIVLLIISFTISAYGQEKLWKELNSKIVILSQQGRYAEAAKLAEEALTVADKTFGPNHPHVATSLNNLAFLYQAQGKYAEADPLYKRSLKSGKKPLDRSIPMWRHP